MNLNLRSADRFDQLVKLQEELGIVANTKSGVGILDCGINCKGGINAGLSLAAISAGCMAEIAIQKSPFFGRTLSMIQVHTDFPLQACMGAQYAGWPLSADKYFAMGSGPIRMIRQKEKLLEEFSLKEEPTVGVLCLESGKLPTEQAISKILDETKLAPENLRIAIAPTRSLAGSIQVVARSVETCLHKLHELGFDLKKINSGIGLAPLPPIATDDLQGIGMTNDAILFAGEVELWVNCSDDEIAAIGPKTPSSSSSDYGRPFYELFKANDFDFYKIDPNLFSPAQVTFNNLATGKSFQFGELNENLIRKSFGY